MNGGFGYGLEGRVGVKWGIVLLDGRLFLFYFWLFVVI